MSWLRDPIWQLGLAILLVVAGAILIYSGAPGADELGGTALFGIVLFGLGVALPLISQAVRAHRENVAKSEDA